MPPITSDMPTGRRASLMDAFGQRVGIRKERRASLAATVDGARNKVATFAQENFVRPWEVKIADHHREGTFIHRNVYHFAHHFEYGAPPSSWTIAVSWSLRSGLAVFLGMIWATLPQIHGKTWQAGGVIAPALGGALMGSAPVRVLGAALMLARLFITGSFIGCLLSVIAIEASRPLADAGVVDQARDMLAFTILGLGYFFIVSRPRLHIAQKKLACMSRKVRTCIRIIRRSGV